MLHNTRGQVTTWEHYYLLQPGNWETYYWLRQGERLEPYTKLPRISRLKHRRSTSPTTFTPPLAFQAGRPSGPGGIEQTGLRNYVGPIPPYDFFDPGP